MKPALTGGIAFLAIVGAVLDSGLCSVSIKPSRRSCCGSASRFA
jgi:hypothetical protein